MVAELGASLMAGRHSAAAEAHKESAMLTLLNGIALSVAELLKSMSFVFQRIDEVPDETRKILLSLRDEDKGAEVIGQYAIFIANRESLIRRSESPTGKELSGSSWL
jgi:hypothetical protein